MSKEEEKKEPESKESTSEEKSKGGNPWIPVIAIVVLLPVLSFVMTEFLLIPRMKKELGGPAEHKSEKSEHDSGAESHEALQQFTFSNIVANLSGSLQSRYIKVAFNVEGSQEDFLKVIEENQTKIVDAALSILSALTINDLEEPGIKNRVRSDLIIAFNTALKKEIVENLYFSEFVVQ